MKKLISTLLSVVMIFGMYPSVFADDIPDGLKSVITSVKQKIDIPNEYSEFDYSIEEYDNKKEYNLEWSKKKDESEKDKDYYEGPINIIADENGNIRRYYTYDTGEEGSISNVKTREECVKASEDFMKKVLPDTYSEFRLDEEENSNGYDVVFKRYKNDVPVDFNDIYIDINKSTLKVREFNYMNSEYTNESFESTDGIISEDDAVKAYLEKVEYNPEYYFNYDFKTGEKKVFLAYRKHAFYNKSVNAKTGDIEDISIYGEIVRYSNSTKEAAMDNAGGVEEELSAAEIEKINSSENIISKEEAIEEINRVIPENIKFEKLNYSALSKDRIDNNKYRWVFNYDNGSASIDAKTKEIINFQFYDGHDYKNSPKKEIPEERKTAAEDFIKKMAPDKFDSVELYKPDSTDISIIFVRKVNGYSFPENNIAVEFDDNGNIISYICYWYDSVEFPKPESVISKEEAFNKVRKTGGLGVSYHFISGEDEAELYRSVEAPVFEDKKRIIALVYSFREIGNSPSYIDAQSGKELDYNGEEFKEGFSVPKNYPDISGHWCEEYVNKLKEYGLYVKREMFLPDEKITKDGFLEYYQTGLTDKYRNAFTENSEYITRREICSVISELLGYGILTNKNIFKNPFSDVNENDENFGGIAAANALNIITADSDGNFYPDREITNAEAAKIIYTLEELRYKRYE